MRLVVPRAAWSDALAGREQSLAEVVLHRGQRYIRTVGQLRHQHGFHSIHGKIRENPAKSVVLAWIPPLSYSLFAFPRGEQRAGPTGEGPPTHVAGRPRRGEGPPQQRVIWLGCRGWTSLMVR